MLGRAWRLEEVPPGGISARAAGNYTPAAPPRAPAKYRCLFEGGSLLRALSYLGVDPMTVSG